MKEHVCKGCICLKCRNIECRYWSCESCRELADVIVEHWKTKGKCKDFKPIKR